MEDLTIRNYEPRDLVECRALWRQLTDWHREIYRDNSIGGEHPELHFDRHLEAAGPGQLWVTVHASKVVGLVGLIMKGDEAELEPLIVAESYRGKGIGKKLLDQAVSTARAGGVMLLTVKPVARNTATIQFLHKQGFTNIGFIELFKDFSNRTWKTGPRMFDCEFRV